jgi:alpha-tubulin suppressor-like RCC1 family protein
LGCGARTSLEVDRAVEAVDAGAEVPIGKVALGARHTCAIRPTGGLACWGAND